VGFPSGQRGRAVNPLAQPSQVRILPPPLSGALASARRRARQARLIRLRKALASGAAVIVLSFAAVAELLGAHF